MPETKNDENNQQFSATENKVEQKPNVEEEARPITLQEHLAQMENDTIEFPTVEVAPTTIAKVDDFNTYEQEKRDVVIEEKKSELVETNETQMASTFTKASDVLNSRSQPIVVQTSKLKSASQHVSALVKGLLVRMTEKKSNKTATAFITGILIGALLTYFLV